MVNTRHTQRIDDLLAYLEREWSAVPDVARRWNTEMDLIDKETFQMEWTIREDKLAKLEHLAAAGKLSANQRERYDYLQQLVARHRSILEGLFSSE